MKKVLFILFVKIYIAVAIGLLIDVHYCMGKIATIAINDTAQGCCGDEKEHKGCCHNSTFIYKVDNEQNTNQGIKIRIAEFFYFSLYQYTDIHEFNLTSEYPNVLKKDFSPPLKQPIYLILNSFVFYG